MQAQVKLATEPRAAERGHESAVRVALVQDSFLHQALFYRGAGGFLLGALPFASEALQRDEAVIVVVREELAESLAHALGEDAERVSFLDAAALANPARAIPALNEFREEHGRGTRGICEAVWPGRSAAELEECERHETLLNEAFANDPPWRLLCPYDLETLSDEAIAAARRTHPALVHEGVSLRNRSYAPRPSAPGPFAGSLPGPPTQREELAFTAGGLGAVRSLVAKHGSRAGLTEVSREDLVLAVNELVTNSVQYGGGGGSLSIWQEPGAVICDVRDRGFIEDPLAGRVTPPVNQYGGRGLWLVNQLCDLVQIRSSAEGTVARVRVATGERLTWR